MWTHMELYELLKRNHNQYCQGKNARILKASCRYLKGIIDNKFYRSQWDIAEEYDITDASITKRYREIAKLLNIKITHERKCRYCGSSFKTRNERREVCERCRRSFLHLCKAWERTSMCITCGELNPFFLLLGDVHKML